MRMHHAPLVVPILVLALVACATTSPPDPAPRPSPAVSAPRYPATSSRVPATSTHRTTASHAAPTRPVVPAAAPGGYVRLRGSPEIHLRSCPRVQRAQPGGVVLAKAGDGPPCYTCRKAEALARLR